MDTTDSCLQVLPFKSYKGDIFITRKHTSSPFSYNYYDYNLYIPFKDPQDIKMPYYVHQIYTHKDYIDVKNLFLKILKNLISNKKCTDIIELTTEEWDYLFKYGCLEESCDNDVLEPEVYNAFIDPANPGKIIFGSCQYI